MPDILLAKKDDITKLNADVNTEGSILKSIKDNAENATYDNSTAGLTADTLGEAIDEVEGRVEDAEDDIIAIKGVGYTEGSLKTHEDRLDTLEGADTVVGSVAKTVKDAVEPVKGTGWNGETVKGNADAINNLVYTDEIEWRLDIELPYLVKYQILYDKTLIGSYNTKLTRFDNELVALWERADIVLTGAPKVYGTSLYCPTASGLIVVSVIDGTDVASYTTYDNCTAVAVVDTDSFYTSHLATNHSKSLVRWASGIAVETVENGNYRDVIIISKIGDYAIYGVAVGGSGYIYAYSSGLILHATSISMYQLRKVFATEMGTFFACSYHTSGATHILDKYLNRINSKLFYILPPHAEYVLELTFSPNGIAYCPVAGIGTISGCAGINANGQLVEVVPDLLSYNYRNSGLYDGEKYFYALVSGPAGTEAGRTGRYTKMRKLYQRSEI